MGGLRILRAPAGPALLAVLAVLAGPATTAAAHGAVYQPPSYGGPGDTHPGGGGGSGGGPTTGPVGPRAPGPSAPGTPGPSAPGTPGPPGPGTPGAPPTTAGPGGGLDATTLESWGLWWELSRDPFLDLARRARGRELEADRTSSAGLVGARPPREVVYGRVVPALVRLIARDGPPEVTAAALIALARIGEDRGRDARGDYLALCVERLDDASLEVAEAALLAVGVLGDPAGAPVCAAILRGGDAGREAVGGAVPARRRALGAAALALCARRSGSEDARRYAVSALAGVLADEERDEVAAACVVGLGLVPLERDPARAAGAPASRRETAIHAADRTRVVALLRGVLADRRRSDLTRAQVPAALARIVGGAGPEDAERRAVVAELAELLAPRSRAPREVARAAAVALGFAAGPGAADEDRAARARLAEHAVEARDAYAARRAWIALARVAARTPAPGDGAAPAGDATSALGDARRRMIDRLGRARDRELPWVALALGVLEHGAREGGHAPSSAAAAALRDRLGAERSAATAAALGLALGLTRDAPGAARLAERLDDAGAPALREALAVALGLAGDAAHANALAAMLAASTRRPGQLSAAATGLALLGDRRAVDALLAALDEAESFAAQAAVAVALGRVGDARAVVPLTELLGDGARTDRSRAFAAAALGAIADRDPLPWTADLKRGASPTALPTWLYDARGFGVLNLL